MNYILRKRTAKHIQNPHTTFMVNIFGNADIIINCCMFMVEEKQINDYMDVI